jgi:hypothetical protein
MRFLLLFVVWATLAFVPSWYAQHAYQGAITAMSGRLAAPRGSEIEFTDVEIFYPFDLGIFVGLCLASGWAAWRERLRAIGIGLPILIAVEVISLVVAIRVIYGAMAGGHSADAAGEAAYRFATGIIRVNGLIAAAAVWLVLLGRQRLSITARA